MELVRIDLAAEVDVKVLKKLEWVHTYPGPGTWGCKKVSAQVQSSEILGEIYHDRLVLGFGPNILSNLNVGTVYVYESGLKLYASW